MSSTSRALVFAACALFIVQLAVWAVHGRSYLRTQVHLDFIENVIEGLEDTPDLKAYYLCEEATLPSRSLSKIRARLDQVGLGLVDGYRDLEPFGELSVDECDCFSVCFTEDLNTPLVGLVEATWQPDITYSVRGARAVYVFVFGRWLRLGFVDSWST